MQDLFMKEAEKYHVLPLDDRLLERTNAELMGRPTVMGDRNTVTYGEGMRGMQTDVFIDLRNKPYTITAEVAVNSNGNGVIVCQGGRFGGLSFYIKNGKPAFSYNYLGLESTQIISNEALKPGNYKLVYDFKYDGGGMGKGGVGTIFVNDKKVAEGRIEKTQPGIFSVDDLADIGVDDGTCVADYGSSAKFNGKIEYVTIERKK
jgi:arylsulfatase